MTTEKKTTDEQGISAAGCLKTGAAAAAPSSAPAHHRLPDHLGAEPDHAAPVQHGVSNINAIARSARPT